MLPSLLEHHKGEAHSQWERVLPLGLVQLNGQTCQDEVYQEPCNARPCVSLPVFTWDDVAFRLNPYPPHYRAAFAFYAILYPHCQQFTLRFTCSLGFPLEQQYGLTAFPICHTTGLGSASSPVV